MPKSPVIVWPTHVPFRGLPTVLWQGYSPALRTVRHEASAEDFLEVNRAVVRMWN